MNATALVGCFACLLLASPLAPQQQQPPLAPAPPAQAAEPSLTIDEPDGTIPVIGPTLFRATLAPPGTPFASVEFRVNDEVACRVTKPPVECRFDVGSWGSSKTIRALARFENGTLLASPEVTTPPLPDVLQETGVMAVPVVVQVKDREGKHLANLPRSAFRVFEDGVPQTINDFRTENVPLEIVVAVDTSDSMRDDLPVLKQAVKRFVRDVRPMDTLTVMAFNDRLYRLPEAPKITAINPATGLPEPVRADNAQLLNRIDGLTTRSGTALYTAILESLRALRKNYMGQAVIVFTDGDDTASRMTEEKLEELVRQSSARLFMIVQGEESKTQRVRRVIKRLTSMSGGLDYSIDRIGELDAVLTRIATDLQSQYYLAYTPTNDKQDGSVRKIDVKVSAAGAQVYARHEYVAGTRSR